MLSEDMNKIQESLKELQDLIEVASFHQRKLQEFDTSLERQRAEHNNFGSILTAMGE